MQQINAEKLDYLPCQWKENVASVAVMVHCMSRYRDPMEHFINIVLREINFFWGESAKQTQ